MHHHQSTTTTIALSVVSRVLAIGESGKAAAFLPQHRDSRSVYRLPPHCHREALLVGNYNKCGSELKVDIDNLIGNIH